MHKLTLKQSDTKLNFDYFVFDHDFQSVYVSVNDK